MKKFKINIVYNNGYVTYERCAENIAELEKYFIKAKAKGYIIVDNKDEGKLVILYKENVSCIECNEIKGGEE